MTQASAFCYPSASLNSYTKDTSSLTHCRRRTQSPCHRWSVFLRQLIPSVPPPNPSSATCIQGEVLFQAAHWEKPLSSLQMRSGFVAATWHKEDVRTRCMQAWCYTTAGKTRFSVRRVKRNIWVSSACWRHALLKIVERGILLEHIFFANVFCIFLYDFRKGFVRISVLPSNFKGVSHIFYQLVAFRRHWIIFDINWHIKIIHITQQLTQSSLFCFL